jgi:pimeloyl-ACP methyl ester carboxylesterase
VHSFFEADAVEIAGQRVPLEYRRTATIAFSLAEADAWATEYRGFLVGDLLDRAPTRLVALSPHRPGRIPVVLVHGTASSAARWADLLNDLLEDPRITRSFEFWFFSYATGVPIPYSALQLREALGDALQRLGGSAADPALRQMVVIGHSQGGLLARMLVIDTGTRLWDGFSRLPPEELQLSADSLSLIRRALFLHPMPEVRRVVFVATPHRGSYVAAFSLAHLVSRLVRLPASIARVGGEVLTGNADAFTFDPRSVHFGSVYGMTPGSRLIRSLSAIPIAPGVRVNSIVAVRGDGPVESGNDGVVEYSSAHIDGAESEVVVRSSHSVQSQPETVEEVRRILLAHLAEFCASGQGCPDRPATPAPGPRPPRLAVSR